MTLTVLAWGPFGPSSVSNSTFAPSGSDLNPSPPTALKWTKTSLLPSAGVMNPKPFESLNHFTVPVAIEITPPSAFKNGQRRREAQPILARFAYHRSRPGPSKTESVPLDLEYEFG